MCTYVLLRDVLGPGTLAFAGNRDERLDRPFDEPRIHEVGGTRASFARDHAGGTWLGVTRSRLVALTNAPLRGGEPATRSRGLLVRDLLAEPTVPDALAALERALSRDRYDGFNLALGDAGALVLASHGDEGLALRELPAGAHVVEHRSGGVRPFEDLGTPAHDDPMASLRALAATRLASHEALEATGHPPCRHEGGRGTVATMLVHLDPREPERSAFLFSRGPACKAELRPVELP